jgi:3-phosphoshikimate 1-carboxyvinyltransferase
MSTLITILQEWGVHFKFEGTPYHLPLRMYGTSALQIPPACISVSSAQVASALQLAALRASGTLSLDVRAGLRDHTEILLRNASSDVPVPKDPSAAAVFAVAAASLPGSDLLLSDVCLNPTRLGFVRVMQRMGADIQTRCCSGDGQNTELRGEIAVRYSRGICATHITAAETPTLVDEIMMLALLATQAEGQTVFEDISPLRNKESDRAEAIFATLKRLGAAVSLSGSTLRVSGPVVLRGGQCLDSRGDHRLVMCHAIAALLTDTKTLDYTDADMVGVSYPDFFAGLDALTQSEDCYTGACLKEKKSEESF